MLSSQKEYSVNLRGVDVREYEANPIVLNSFNEHGKVLGRARILRQKRKVLVDYIGEIPNYPHSIGTGVVQYNNSPDKLIGLSVIPIVASR